MRYRLPAKSVTIENGRLSLISDIDRLRYIQESVTRRSLLCGRCVVKNPRIKHDCSELAMILLQTGPMISLERALLGKSRGAGLSCAVARARGCVCSVLYLGKNSLRSVSESRDRLVAIDQGLTIWHNHLSQRMWQTWCRVLSFVGRRWLGKSSLTTF